MMLKDVVFILLINVKMPTIVGILAFLSRVNFMLICVEHVKSFIISGQDLASYCICDQQRLKQACVSAQSDHSLPCSYTKCCTASGMFVHWLILLNCCFVIFRHRHEIVASRHYCERRVKRCMEAWRKVRVFCYYYLFSL